MHRRYFKSPSTSNMKKVLLLAMAVVSIGWSCNRNAAPSEELSFGQFQEYLEENHCPKGFATIYSYKDLQLFPQVDSASVVFHKICQALGLDNPLIYLLGWEKLPDGMLVEVYAEDLYHIGFDVLLVDAECSIVDYLCLIEPIDGDQLEYTDEGSCEWHRKANFAYRGNRVIEEKLDVDVLDGKERIDTLRMFKVHAEYAFDFAEGFSEVARDTVVTGSPN